MITDINLIEEFCKHLGIFIMDLDIDINYETDIPQVGEEGDAITIKYYNEGILIATQNENEEFEFTLEGKSILITEIFDLIKSRL